MFKNSRTIIIPLLILQIIFLPLQDFLAAQDLSADDLIAQAKKNYYEGSFDQAIALIKTCLQETKLEKGQLQEAYKILAQAYLAKNYTDAAREVVVKLLEVNPLYAPTIEEEPPPFVQLVNEVRQQKSPEAAAQPESDNKWLWIGAGGALVIGAATFIIFNNNDDDKVVDNKLAGPPPMPAK
jgi:tetratricopeptide (TPR) repeat protein